jgi:hypothetical protein
MGIVSISYEDMLEPLGQSEVLANLERLATGRQIHLLSFEKVEDWPAHEKCQRIVTSSSRYVLM